MRPSIISLLLALTIVTACSNKPAASSGPEKHYALSGEIVSLDAKAQTATVNAAAIPNYMEAMTMDYPVQSAADFKDLHVGDKIKATLNVSNAGEDYNLSNIQKQNSGTK